MGKKQTAGEQRERDSDTLAAESERLNDWMEGHNAEAGQKAGLQDVDSLLSSTDDWEGLRRTIDLLKANVGTATALRENTGKQVEGHAKERPQQTKEALSAERDNLEQHSVQGELIEAKTRLQSHDNAVRRMGSMAGELKAAGWLRDDWNEIFKATGSDGETLRKIAQCYTLRFLVEHANDQIRKFNSRYELVQVKNSLGLRVIDHDRADDIRDTTSLSGGETFIVSLGLALGLSSLSSRNVSFDNLFIDEGFGTLDPDALATVIDSLAMLQTSQGKKVGVISHTDTMSERITTQIRVIRNGSSGSSHIEIYPE